MAVKNKKKIKQKNSFLAANTSYGFGSYRDKKSSFYTWGTCVK